MALIATDDGRAVTAVAVFTQNRFVAPPVILGQRLLPAAAGAGLGHSERAVLGDAGIGAEAAGLLIASVFAHHTYFP